jgi:hypothetical protein
MINQPVRESVHSFLTADPAVQFFIPTYQKTYTWKPEEETDRFMNDAEGILKRKHRHFLGLIIYRTVNAEGGQKQLEIVEGQQRLTTIYLYLSALYQEAKKRNNRELAEQIMSTYLSCPGMPFGLRFQPSLANRQVYFKLINQSMELLTWNEKQSLLYQNDVYIARYVSVLADRYSLEDMLDVLKQMEIIAFPLEADDDVQQIFESINLAGSYMTFSDRLRDFIFMNCSGQEQTTLYQMYWQPLEQIFPDADAMNMFVRCYLAVKTGSMLDKNKAYDGFKVYWGRVNDPIVRKVSDLYGYALSYQMVYAGPCDDPAVEEALQDYPVASYKEPAVILMEIMHRFRMNEISTEETIQIIRLLDTYMTRRSILCLDNKNLAGWFPSLLRALRPHYKKEPGELYNVLRDSLLNSTRSDFPHGMPSDKQIRNAVRTVNIYSSPRTVRVLLERIERGSSSVRVDMSHLNIEHIMPVHPTAYWRSVSKCQDDGEYNLYANLLGNLTLADQSDNMEMGNDSFEKKKKILAQTLHIHLNADVLKETVWNKKTILARCDAMTDQLLKLFPYPIRQNEKKEEKKPEKKQNVLPKEADEPRPETAVYYDKDLVHAKAVQYRSGMIAVEPGSQIRAYGEGSMKANRKLYDAWVEEGKIQENEDGYAYVSAPLFFGNLTDAASFVTQRGGDNHDVWKNRKDALAIDSHLAFWMDEEPEEESAAQASLSDQTEQPKAADDQDTSAASAAPAVNTQEEKKAELPEQKAEPSEETVFQKKEQPAIESRQEENKAEKPAEEVKPEEKEEPVKPKKKTVRRRKAEPAEEETPAEEKKPATKKRSTKKAAEPAEEEKPAKKTVKRKKKDEPAESESASAAKKPAGKKAAARKKAEPAEKPAEKKTAPKKKAEEKPAEKKAAVKKKAETEEKPVRKTSRKKKTEEPVTEIDDALKEESVMEEKKNTEKKKTVKKAAPKKKADEKKTETEKVKKKTSTKKSDAEKEKKTTAPRKKKAEASAKTAGTGKKKTAAKAAAAHRKPAARKSAQAKKPASQKKAGQKTFSKKRNNRPGLRMKPQSNHSRSAEQPVKVVTFAGQSR